MQNTFWIVLLAALVLVGGIVWTMLPKPNAVSENSDNEAVIAQAAALEIALTEFSFTVDGQNPNDPINLVAGQTYTITFANTGNVEHEVLVGNGDLLQRDDGTADGYSNNFFSGQTIAVRFSSDETKKLVQDLEEIELEPGQSATVTLTVPQSYAGQTFEIGCFEPGHYEADMKAAIIVQ